MGKSFAHMPPPMYGRPIAQPEPEPWLDRNVWVIPVGAVIVALALFGLPIYLISQDRPTQLDICTKSEVRQEQIVHSMAGLAALGGVFRVMALSQPTITTEQREVCVQWERVNSEYRFTN